MLRREPTAEELATTGLGNIALVVFGGVLVYAVVSFIAYQSEALKRMELTNLLLRDLRDGKQGP